MASLRRDMSNILKRLESEFGCTIRMGRSGHYRITRPGFLGITASATPSDQQALAHIVRDARRYLGVQL